MLKLSSSRGIRIDVPVLSVSWSFVDHSVIIQALKKGLIEHEASDTGGVPRWNSSCPDRLAEATISCILRICLTKRVLSFLYHPNGGPSILSRSDWEYCLPYVTNKVSSTPIT